ncbi:uncharacterized protein LOC134857234 [Symsagittifera roscoffensis]|uniref:uncharacterized protein LOC134857234 n=1 Tax=Symsagittifera roscoffensis TaxID=84072 RepID=UPI00307C0214
MIKAEVESGADCNNNPICSSCSIALKVESTFTCRSCLGNVEGTFCRSCILAHLRKNHAVRNHSGKEVTVCDTHQNIAHKYCETCDVVFCMECFEDHAQHVFKPLVEKEENLNSEIQGHIGRLEKDSKPVLKRKQLMSNICNKMLRSADHTQESRDVFNLVAETFMDKFDDVFKENKTSCSKSIVDSINNSKKCLESVEEKLNVLRDLGHSLPMQGVQKLNEIVSNCEEALSRAPIDSDEHMYLMPLHLKKKLPDKMLFEIAAKMLELLQFPELVRSKVIKPAGIAISPEKRRNQKQGLLTYNHSLNGRIFCISKSGEKKISFSLHPNLTSVAKKSKAIIDEIRYEDIKSAYCYENLMVLNLIGSEKIVIDIDVSEIVKKYDAVSEPLLTPEVLFVYPSHENDCECIFYEPNLSSIRLSGVNLSALSIDGVARPKCLDLHFEFKVMAYADFSDSVWILSLISKKQLKIEKELHGLNTVDEVHFLGDRTLLLFENESRIVVALTEEIKESSWKLSSVHRLNEGNFISDFIIEGDFPVLADPKLKQPHNCENASIVCCCKKGKHVDGTAKKVRRVDCCNFEPVDSFEIVFANKYYARFSACRHSDSMTSQTRDQNLGTSASSSSSI